MKFIDFINKPQKIKAVYFDMKKIEFYKPENGCHRYIMDCVEIPKIKLN